MYVYNVLGTSLFEVSRLPESSSAWVHFVPQLGVALRLPVGQGKASENSSNPALELPQNQKV